MPPHGNVTAIYGTLIFIYTYINTYIYTYILGGNAMPPHENVTAVYDLLFFETEWYRETIAFHPLIHQAIHSFSFSLFFSIFSGMVPRNHCLSYTRSPGSSFFFFFTIFCITIAFRPLIHQAIHFFSFPLFFGERNHCPLIHQAIHLFPFSLCFLGRNHSLSPTHSLGNSFFFFFPLFQKSSVE